MAAMALKAIVSIAIALSVSGCFQSMGPLTALNLLMMSMPRPSADAVATSDSQPVTYVTNTTTSTTYVSNTTYVTSSGGGRSSGHSHSHRRSH
jgi:hypothetical protein